MSIFINWKKGLRIANNSSKGVGGEGGKGTEN